MTKKQQKWIALFVSLTFLWLLQVSAMPLAGASTTERLGPANDEQGPRYVEEEGDSGYRAKKSSALPLILGIVGVAAVAAVLFLVVLKTKYDIVGTWTIHVTYDSEPDVFDSITTFTGDKKSGTTKDNWNGTGTYTVDDKKVTFTLRWPNNNTSTFTGQFDEKDKMSGRFHESNNFDGPWTAVRSASSASVPKLKKAGANQGPGK